MPNPPRVPPASPDQFLASAPDTATRMSICLRTLQKLTKRGTLPCVRIGRRVLYDPAEVAAFIQSVKERRG